MQRDQDLAVLDHAEKLFSQYKWHLKHQDIFSAQVQFQRGFRVRGPGAG